MSHLTDILNRILDLETWTSEIHVEIEDFSVINPNIKVNSIKKYLRNIGFIKSRIYKGQDVYLYRWIDSLNNMPLFHKSMDRSSLFIFKTGGNVSESKPITHIDIFDARIYNYERCGTLQYYNRQNIECFENISNSVIDNYFNNNCTTSYSYVAPLNNKYSSNYLPSFDTFLK